MSIKLRGLQEPLRPYAEYALAWAQYYGIPVTVTSVRRTFAEQQRLYDRWQRGLSKFPANRPGTSAHEYGLAWDSTVPAQYQSAWNTIRQWVGWEVLPNDIIHAQLPRWRDYVDRSP